MTWQSGKSWECGQVLDLGCGKREDIAHTMSRTDTHKDMLLPMVGTVTRVARCHVTSQEGKG